MRTPRQSKLPLPSLAFAACLAVVVCLILFRAFHLSGYDLRVPFTHAEADSVVTTMYIKGLVQDGWPNAISQLSAPYGYPGAAFPLMTSFDWAIMKLMSLGTREAGMLANGFWLLTFVFSAWSAAYAAYQIRLSAALSFATGLLYAFLPFAMIRNVHHLNLAYYLVPLLCLLAIVIATRGEGIRNRKQAVAIGLLACAAQGFDYVYYSFFAVLLFGMAAVIGWRRGDIRTLKLPAAAIALVGICTAINLAPAFQTWREVGKPVEMAYKSAAEAEIYGAKLRRMLLPHINNPVEPLARIVRRDSAAGFPQENENQTARLGLYGAFGLLLLFLSLVRREERPGMYPAKDAACGLGLLTFLVITVGGLGAVINVLTVPDIRAYNRYSVYLSFFASAAAGFWIQEKLAGMSGRRRIAAWIAVGGLVMFSLYDQLLDRVPMLWHREANLQNAALERGAVERLERQLPRGASVLQLPLTGFPPLYQFGDMASYDHGRAYLWSTHLKWSWPSLSQQHRAWQSKLGSLQGAELVKAAALSGFDAIWIDRKAYPDQGNALIAGLAVGDVKPIDIGSHRYAVLDVRAAASGLKAALGDAEFLRQATALLDNDALIEWKRGFYDEERNPEGRRFRWAKNRARLDIGNVGEHTLLGCATFVLASPNSGEVRFEGTGAPLSFAVSGTPQTVRIPLRLQPHERQALTFSTDLPRLNAPGDRRQLHFYVMDFELSLRRSTAGDSQPCGGDPKQTS
ncbi:MAG TPA: hypothetical protein VEC06_14125 [Paucimonas sp.]|nr:hypothetical protein [Paucimonas sp.]